jgi:hypothetical protein
MERAANMLSKQMLTADKGLSSSFGVGPQTGTLFTVKSRSSG